MTGSAIALSTLVTAVTHAKQIIVQGATANVAATSVGNASLTATTNIGATTGPVASVQRPIVLGPCDQNALPLNTVYVIGTNNEVAYISVIS